jgi:hypothetical protein
MGELYLDKLERLFLSGRISDRVKEQGRQQRTVRIFSEDDRYRCAVCGKRLRRFLKVDGSPRCNEHAAVNAPLPPVKTEVPPGRC